MYLPHPVKILDEAEFGDVSPEYQCSPYFINKLCRDLLLVDVTSPGRP